VVAKATATGRSKQCKVRHWRTFLNQKCVNFNSFTSCLSVLCALHSCLSPSACILSGSSNLLVQFAENEMCEQKLLALFLGRKKPVTHMSMVTGNRAVSFLVRKKFSYSRIWKHLVSNLWPVCASMDDFCVIIYNIASITHHRNKGHSE